MKLRNKKTGEIIELLTKLSFVKRNDDYLQSEVNTFNSIAELNAEWADYYEEPKEYWRITDLGELKSIRLDQHHQNIEKCKEIGNYFETKEEAEKVVEKLKAIKRLKDYNVKFNLDFVKNKIDFTYSINNLLLDVLDGEEQIFNNMKIIFGGEE